MDFRLLGPLEVVIADEAPLNISSAREVAIMTILLLHANRVVPVGQLIDAVWDDSPPSTAKSQVQQCISALRRKVRLAGGSDLLATGITGYVIRVPEDSIDVTRFHELTRGGRLAVAEGKVADAAAALRSALSLWRGPACTGVDSRLVRAAAARLDEDRLMAVETCIDLELQLGHHRDLAGELGGLVQQYPLRERLHALHMLALHRSGLKAAALEAFRAARTVLVEELGLEPGDELSALHRGILADDPALGPGSAAAPAGVQGGPATTGVPRQLPSAIADFTGRREEVDGLTSLLAAPDEGAIAQRYLPVAVLRGKGGVGKTALAVHAAHALRQHYPDGHLYAQLRDGDGQPVATADVLAWFLRALGLPSAALPDGLAERTATYRSLLGERRVLIVLDDAHGTSQVLPLIPGNPGCGVMITSRDMLSGLHGSRYFDIGDLHEAASVRLLGTVIGDDRVADEPSAALALVRVCGCLPLALRIVAAKLVARPHWKLEEMVRRLANEERRLDELAIGDVGIRATVALSYESQDLAARQLFRLVGLLGAADFGAWITAPLLGCDAAQAAELLEALVEARLVDVSVKNGSARFRLHELVRVYARERLAAEEPAERRAAALERVLGCWMMLAEEAHRRTYRGDFAVLHGTASRFELSAELVDTLLANPLGWLRAEEAGLVSAVHQAAQAGLDELCWDLAMTLVTLFESDYQADNWRRTHEVALEAVRRAGNTLGEAAMLYSRGQLAIAERPASGARYLASALAAFEQLGHGHGTALALAGLAYVDRLDGHYELALSRYATSRDLFRQAGDRVSEVDCMTSMAQIHADREEFEAARGLLVEALTACQTLAAPRIIAQTDYRMGSFLLSTGDLTQAERHLRLSLQVVRDEGDTIGEVYALHALATVHAVQRRHSISNAEFRAALDLSRQVGEKLVHGRVLLAYAEALEARPERDYAAALAGEALAVFGEVGGPLVLCAQAHALQARLSGPDWAAGGAAEGPHAAPSRPHGGPAWPCDAGEAW